MDLRKLKQKKMMGIINKGQTRGLCAQEKGARSLYNKWSPNHQEDCNRESNFRKEKLDGDIYDLIWFNLEKFSNEIEKI